MHSPPLRNASPVSSGITRRGKIPLRPTRAEAMTEHAQISIRSTDVHDHSHALTASTNFTELLGAASCWARVRLCWAKCGRWGLEPTDALARWISAPHGKQLASTTIHTTHANTNNDHRSAMIAHDRRQLFTHLCRSISSILLHRNTTPHPKTTFQTATAKLQTAATPTRWQLNHIFSDRVVTSSSPLYARQGICTIKRHLKTPKWPNEPNRNAVNRTQIVSHFQSTIIFNSLSGYAGL